jgi:hypothetical protein
MKAGFALAALLLDDRDLHEVEGALPATPPDLAAELALLCAHAVPRASTARDREHGLGSLLRALRPELTVAGALSLPPRARALIARFYPAHARKALCTETPPLRAEFVADEELLRALARLSRSAAEAEAT